MPTPKVTQDNFCEAIDKLAPIDVLETVSAILWQLNDQGIDLDRGWLEKPWRWAEVWVPALNNEPELITQDFIDNFYKSSDDE